MKNYCFLLHEKKLLFLFILREKKRIFDENKKKRFNEDKKKNRFDADKKKSNNFIFIHYYLNIIIRNKKYVHINNY
jgi:hypothetical protein